jgi:hypothetical protein
MRIIQCGRGKVIEVPDHKGVDPMEDTPISMRVESSERGGIFAIVETYLSARDFAKLESKGVVTKEEFSSSVLIKMKTKAQRLDLAAALYEAALTLGHTGKR